MMKKSAVEVQELTFVWHMFIDDFQDIPFPVDIKKDDNIFKGYVQEP